MSSCQDPIHEGFSKTESGLEYKVVYIGDEQVKPDVGDRLLLQITHFDGEVEMPSYEQEIVYKDVTDTSLQEIVSKMYVGDRLQAYVDGLRLGVVDDRKGRIRVEVELLRKRSDRELALEGICVHLPTMFLDHLESPMVDSLLAYPAIDCQIIQGARILYGSRGSGLTVDSCSFARIRYEGFLLDGTKFDSTIDRGEHFEWEPNQKEQVLKGFEMLKSDLHRGDDLWLILPPYLAFGERGSTNGAVASGETVMYHLNIISVE